MLSVYVNGDRVLLWHGDADDARADGVRVHDGGRAVTVGGVRRQVVNNAFYPERGDVALWVS